MHLHLFYTNKLFKKSTNWNNRQILTNVYLYVLPALNSLWSGLNFEWNFLLHYLEFLCVEVRMPEAHTLALAPVSLSPATRLWRLYCCECSWPALIANLCPLLHKKTYNKLQFYSISTRIAPPRLSLWIPHCFNSYVI